MVRTVSNLGRISKMLLKRDLIKEFTNDAELKSFCEQTWGDYIRNLDESIINKLISIQSHGLKRGNCYDDVLIDTYQREIWKFPPVPFDIIVYRGGEMRVSGRPFLSTSFYKETAAHFANKKNKIHTIIIRKGAHIVPSLYLWHPGSFPEQEVVLDVSCLHRRIGYYEYYKK